MTLLVGAFLVHRSEHLIANMRPVAYARLPLSDLDAAGAHGPPDTAVAESDRF